MGFSQKFRSFLWIFLILFALHYPLSNVFAEEFLSVDTKATTSTVTSPSIQKDTVRTVAPPTSIWQQNLNIAIPPQVSIENFTPGEKAPSALPVRLGIPFSQEEWNLLSVLSNQYSPKFNYSMVIDEMGDRFYSGKPLEIDKWIGRAITERCNMEDQKLICGIRVPLDITITDAQWEILINLSKMYNPQVNYRAVLQDMQERAKNKNITWLDKWVSRAIIERCQRSNADGINCDIWRL